jgi:type IV pilus assembly protein PilY1
LVIVICLGFILPPLLLAENPDYSDGIAGDNEMALNSTIDGYLEYKFPFGDSDYFRIVVPSQGTLTIYSESILPMDPDGALYAQPPPLTMWTVLASNGDKNYGDNQLDFEIVQQVDPGTYHIQVHSSSATQGDYTLHVEFNGSGAVTHTITASAGSGGSISPAGAASVADGGTQSFTIIPDACYGVQNVLVDSLSQGAVTSYTFSNVTSDHTISASFASAGSYTISASAGSGGSISPSASVSVSCGASKSFTISPGGGYEIFDVKVDGTSVGAVTSYTFSNVAANHTIAASFSALSSNTITTTAGPNGSISPAGPVSVASGGSQSFTITANAGYQIQDVQVDGGSVGTVSSYTFSNVDADHSLAAQFEYTGAPPPPPGDCIEISDTPLDARFLAAPPSIMFVLDDSGSMDWEVMTGESDGTFDGKYYVFDDPGDNVYSSSLYSSNYMSSTDRQKWQSQWSGYNRMYYNPRTIYAPWPTMGSADTAMPRSHPYHASPTFNMAAEYVDTGSILLPGIRITNAHYYTWDDANKNYELDSNETVYLVNFVDDDSNGTLDDREWYRFDDDGDDVVEATELMPVMKLQVPESVHSMSFADDLQNFANWYSYYRRRELTTIAAVARVIVGAQGMQIGLYGINGSVNEPVRKIDVDGVDETDTLLDELYRNYNASLVGTPLRAGLQSVGRYFHQDDGSDGGIGPSPFAAANGSECMQAFEIVMTDGYYNGLTFSFTNADRDNGVPYKDLYSSTLADVAMYYYENDLSASLDNLVPTNERDDATHQHMVTYGVGFGVTGTLNPDDFDSNPTHADFLKNAYGSYPHWPNPASGDQQKIDDLWHASVNGRGRFLTSSKPLDLINSLLLVLKSIKLNSGSASSVSVNGDELYTKINNDTLLFQAKYYTETWHGDVLAFQIDAVTGELVKPALWSAAYNLSGETASNRKIATYDGTTSGQSFRFNRLTDVQKTQLDANWQTDDTLARNIVDYLRGDPSNETDRGGAFRDRSWSIADADHPYNGTTISSSTLGDIVHSSPVYENGALYVGGNDGMLHVLEAATGEELFAYLPNLVFENLASLTNPDYTHKYFVDLTPTVKNGAGLLEGKPPSTATDAQTILVGGLGKGAKGYYALDISNVKPLEGSVPLNENAVANLVLWEYPNLNTPAVEVADMGYSFSKAAIAQSNDVDAAPWIAIFGNGYNSLNGHAVLLILDSATGELLKKLETQAGSCNGLSAPIVIDVNYDRKVDYVYAGDLKGNLWKFDLTDSDYHNWDLAYDEGGAPKPLFATPNQPITIKPDVMYQCFKEGYMVFFGTGKYLGQNDLSDTSPQAIYGIWDYGDDADDGEYVGDFNSIELTDSNLPDTTSLFHQTIDETTVNGVKFRAIAKADTETNTAPYWHTTAQDPNGVGDNPDPDANVGWYLDLSPGERVISDVVIRDGKLRVNTYVPNDSLCGTDGNSWLMAMNACNGGELLDLNLDINGDSAINEEDMVPIVKNGVSKLMVPTGMQFSGHVQSPAIIIMGNGREILYMSSSNGKIETLGAKAAKLGITYWRVYRP